MRALLLQTVFALVATLVGAGCTTQTRDPTFVSGPVAVRVDSALRSLEPLGFSGVVLLAKNGTPLLRKGYGFANRAEQVPLTANSLVQIGSNVKDFTAVAILQLAERSKLSLEDSLARFFEDVPADKRAVTVQQLLSHQAGFAQHLDGDFVRTTREQGIAKALASPLLFAPGQRESYSNVGFSLLASIIEKVSGKTYEEYVAQNIFRPLNMTETGYVRADASAQRHSHGYAGDEDQGAMGPKLAALGGDYWNLLGNGGMVSTVQDMFKFYRGLFESDRLLTPTTKARRFGTGPRMLAGSDRVSFFMYNSEPGGMELIIATNSRDYPAPRARRAIAPMLGIAGPRDGPQREISTTSPGGSSTGGASDSGARPMPGDVNFPDTPAGRMARRYVAAISSDNADSVRSMVRASFAPSPPGGPGIEQRAERSIGVQTNLGRLTLLEIEKSTDESITFVTRSARVGRTTITVNVERVAPHRITSVQVLR